MTWENVTAENGSAYDYVYENASRSGHGIENCYEMFPTEISWALTIIGLFGAAANFVTLYILAYSKMKTSFKTFLIGLAVFDLISCSAASFSLAQHNVPAGLANFLYWLFNFGMSGSIWFTVLVTTERYTAVCMPLEHRSKFWTSRKIKLSVLLILSLDFGINSPLGALFIIKHSNVKKYKNVRKILLASWSVLLLLEFVISVFIVVALNTYIYRKIVSANEKRKKLSQRQRISVTSEELKENEYTNLTVMVLCVYICLYIYPTVAILRCPQSLVNIHKSLSDI